LYYIENNGEVVSSVDRYVLRIIKLGADFELNLDESIFLQLIKTSESAIEIGEEITEHVQPTTSSNEAANDASQEDPSFIYPLIPGVSPLFRTKFNAFILPDLQSNDGASIALMIPQEYDELVLDIFCEILKGVVKENGEVVFGDFTKIGETEQSVRIRRSAGEKISENIVTGAFWISKGLVNTAQKTGEFIDYSTPYILSKMKKAEDNVPVASENLNKSVTVARSMSGYAAQGTSFLAEKIGGAMSNFGQFLAPHVQKKGSELLTYTVGMEPTKAENTMKETLKIASGASEAISTIYSGLETSASILGKNLADNSVKIVRHKYGESYGEVSEKGFDTVGNLIQVNRSFNILTPKGLVKSTAKSAGKGILKAEEFRPKVYLNRDYFTGTSSLYPSLDNLAKEVSKPKF
jgi:hypothetical protein